MTEEFLGRRSEAHNPDNDPSLQEALRQSLRERERDNIEQRPPPYNPDYVDEEENTRPSGGEGSHADEEIIDPMEARRINEHMRNARLRRFEETSDNYRRRPLS